MLIAIALMTTGCDRTAPRDLTPCPEKFSETGRLSAMVVVHSIAQAWDSEDASHKLALELPPQSEITSALAALRCEDTARARSRRMRAIAVLLAHSWQDHQSTPYLLELGFSDQDAIDRFKAKVLSEFPPEAMAIHGHDPAWLEYAVLRHTTVSGDLPSDATPHASIDILGAATAHADTQPSCWRPEAPSTSTFVNPYLELTAHVSVSKSEVDTTPDIDAQRWNDCGRFWSPPNPANPGTSIDGAQFVLATWTPCATPTPPLPPDTKAPAPGSIYEKQFLWERFFVQLPLIGNAHFENMLGIWTFHNPRLAADGTSVDAYRLSFHLGSCGNDQVTGAMGGAIGKSPMKVVRDSGYIEVWAEGGEPTSHHSKMPNSPIGQRTGSRS